MHRLRRLRAGLPGNGNFCVGGFAGEVVELYSGKLELVRQEIGGGEHYEDFAGNGEHWRAVLYLPRSLDGSGIQLGELPGAFAALQSALFDFF
jgi:hypothetical protein